MYGIMGEKIKELRSAKKMTQTALAERVGVTKAAISAYENGTRQPSYPVLMSIANVFNISADVLLGNNKRDVIDVTYLTPSQRSYIQQMVSTFIDYNYMYEKLIETKVDIDQVKKTLLANYLSDEDTYYKD